VCNYLSSAAEEAGLSNFFSCLAGLGRAEWVRLRQNAVLTCSVILSRPLELWEQEMFLFPRSCHTCHSVTPQSGANMLDCTSCLAVTYCSPRCQQDDGGRHLPGDREGPCHQLKLARLLDQYEATVGVGMPGFPDHLDPQYYGSQGDIKDFLCPDIIMDQDKSTAVTQVETDWVFLTNHLSGPLTLLDQAHIYLEGLETRKSLEVHVAGAGIYEMMGIIKWEYLAHRLPNLKRLQITFIGPELESEGGSSQPEDYTCSKCRKLDRVVTYKVVSTTYQGFRKRRGYSKPDIILVQNCGFSEFEADPEVEGWARGWMSGLPALLGEEGSLVVVTSYTQGEAARDMERLTQHCGLQSSELEVLVSEERNGMRSHRPIRDWERDQDRDTFYSNQFISVVRRKEKKIDNLDQDFIKLNI